MKGAHDFEPLRPEFKRLSLQQARIALNAGYMSEDQWVAYCHGWQTGAPRFGTQVCHCEDCRAAPGYPHDAP